MNGVNLQAAMHNLTQMERLASDVVRAPVVNGAQNTQIARDQDLRRLQAPAQAEQNDARSTIDPDDKRHEKNSGKQKSAHKRHSSNTGRSRSRDGGLIVDIDA